MAATSDLRLLINNDYDDFTVAITPTAVLPGTATQEQGDDNVVRVSGTSLTIKGSQATALNGNTFGVFYTNLIGSTTIQLLMYAGENQTGTVLINASVAHEESTTHLDRQYYLAGDSVSYKSFSIVITASSNSYIDVGRIFLGESFIPTYTFDSNYSINHRDTSKIIETDGGGIVARKHTEFREFEITLSVLSDTERGTLSGQLNNFAKNRDILICLDPTLTGDALQEKTMVAYLDGDYENTERWNDTNQIKLKFVEAVKR
jgi:hypothetical protein|tara:strand:+ start:663 stop:1445 length:783 start_codon:yes stop_codon:yes gene_type:complete